MIKNRYWLFWLVNSFCFIVFNLLCRNSDVILGSFLTFILFLLLLFVFYIVVPLIFIAIIIYNFVTNRGWMLYIYTGCVMISEIVLLLWGARYV